MDAVTPHRSTQEVEPDFQELETDEKTQAKLEEELAEKMQVFGSRLQTLVDEQIGQRVEIEDRWVDDLRQYNGQYDSETAEKLKDRSSVFVNETRYKTNTGEARVSDLLFPTDDRNWGIRPTPVPDIEQELDNKEPINAQMPDGSQATVGDQAEAMIDEARQKSEAMEREIDDQLVEAQYAAKARDALHDAALFGTGIIKGPVVIGNVRKKWVEQDGSQVLTMEEVLEATVDYVSIWDFYPDMSATRYEDAEFVFERHYMTRRELRNLAKNPSFIQSEIEKLLKADPRSSSASASRINEIRSLSGLSGTYDESRYEIWEYHGPIDKEDLEACGCDVSESPLEEYEGVVWFCQGRVLKAVVNPMDNEERPYSVMIWERDDAAIFGYGIPYLMRDSQTVINAAWRMILDNAALSSGPQIVVNRQLVSPADGNWALSPRKLWYTKDKNRSVNEVFGAFEINSHQAELGGIFEQAKRIIDEETAIPMIAQGEQGASVTQTASGMSMLMSNHNIVLRRTIKNFDDKVTTPLIRRFYDWNMQFNEKEEIKGDYKIDARGSGALMAKEIQSQNIMMLMQVAQSPAFAPLTDFPSLYRKAIQAMDIPADEVVKDDSQIQAEQQQAAERPPQQDPMFELKMQEAQIRAQTEQAKLQFQQQDAQMDAQLRQMEMELKAQQMQMDQIKMDNTTQVAMAKMASDRDMTVEQLRIKLGIEQAKIESSERKMAFEAKVKTEFGSGL